MKKQRWAQACGQENAVLLIRHRPISESLSSKRAVPCRQGCAASVLGGQPQPHAGKAHVTELSNTCKSMENPGQAEAVF